MVKHRSALVGVLLVAVILAAPVVFFAQVRQSERQGAARAGGPSSKRNPLFDSADEMFLGLTVKVPLTEWTATKDIQPRLRVLTINNFDSKYLHGGLIPRNGAEIVVVADASATSFTEADSIVQEHLKGDKRINVASMTLAGCGAKRVESESDFGPYIVYRNDAVFLTLKTSASPVLYKLMLSYNSNEPPSNVNTFKKAFDQVLNSIQFTAGTQCLGLL
jgi:hypothetical protein